MFLVTREIGGLINGMLYVCKEGCIRVCVRVCVRVHACSEVPCNKEKPLEAPLASHLLFISIFPDMFFSSSCRLVSLNGLPNSEVISS